MRKQECVHLHALLAEITRYLVEREELPPSSLATYDALQTRPSSIHRSRREHREALRVLAGTLDGELGRPSDDPPDPLIR